MGQLLRVCDSEPVMVDTTIKFQHDSGYAYIDLRTWILNRNISDTNELVRKYLKVCTNKHEVCPAILEICQAFRDGDIDERPYGYRTNKAINHKFWRRIEILEDAVKKYE